MSSASAPLATSCDSAINDSATDLDKTLTPHMPQQQDHHSLSHAYNTYLAHDVDEKTHWEDVCRSFRQYAAFAMAQWASHQYRLHALPEEQRQFLPPALRRESPEFQQRAKLYKEAAIRNQFCLDCILRHAGQPNSQEAAMLHHSRSSSQKSGPNTTSVAEHSTDSQMSKVSSVLKSLARDWSREGKSERETAYQPILDQVKYYLPTAKSPQSNQQLPPPGAKRPRGGMPGSSTVDPTAASGSSTVGPPPRLCVPGAGVGRLACELAALGYAAQGNEFSLYMLLASDFILNGGIATPEHPLQISPYLLESRNIQIPTDPIRPIAIPDVDPFKMILPNGCDESKTESGEEQADFSMAAGDFVSIYSNPRESGKWDGFVACFFLDTAPSIIEYITVMHKCLKPGGFVFHFGPLLWHWSGPAMRPDDKAWDAYQCRYNYLDKKYLTSVDLSWQDVRAIFVNVGFDIVEENAGAQAQYTADQKSMMNMSYRCVQFVARKKGGTTPLPPPRGSSTSTTAMNTTSAQHVIPEQSNPSSPSGQGNNTP